MKINANANDKVDKNENECILLKINGSEFVWVKAMNMYRNGLWINWNIFNNLVEIFFWGLSLLSFEAKRR